MAQRSRRRVTRRAATIGLAALCLALPAARAAATSVAVQACGCLLKPGDHAGVAVSYSNSTGDAGQLLVELTLPNSKKLYLSPVGLIARPSPWVGVAAGASGGPSAVIDQTLTAQSLPFGSWPLVPPFRYSVSAILVDATNGAQLAPSASNYFDFEPFQPSPPPTTPGTLHVFPHQHEDPAWLVPEADSFPAMADWIAASIDLAHLEPTYKFVIDQPLVMQEFEQRRPDLTADLQQLIDQGRVEVAGGFYVTNDLNLLSGESIVRNIVYGQRYLEQHWGHRARIAWNLDQFGHPDQMPQLASKGGMSYYAFTRGLSSPAALGLPGSEFYWRSPDGSRVLANVLSNGYQLARSLGDVSPDDQELTEIFRRVQPSSATGHFLAGDGADVSEQVLHGYPLNTSLPEAIAAWNASQVPGVSAEISTPSEFFSAVEQSGVELPTIGPIEFQTDGEANDPRVFPAAYASHMEVKQANNRLENLLTDTEKLSTLAWIEGASYPESDIETQGKNIARDQTHDYLPGTGIDAIYDDPDSNPDDFGDRSAQAEAALDGLRGDAMDYLTGHVDTRLAHVTDQKTWVVFNTMAWERTDLVRIPIAANDIVQPAKLVDGDGHEIAYQISQKQSGGFELVFVATLPATGYATFHMTDGMPAQAPGEVGGAIPSGLAIQLGQHFRMNVDKNGYVRGLFANATNEPLMQLSTEPPPIDGLGGLLWWTDDIYGTAYDYGPPANTGSQAGQTASTYSRAGPVMTRVVSVGNVASSSMAIREVDAIPALGRVEFDTTVYWTDVNKNLYVRFPFQPKVGAQITSGVPYGFTVRGAGHQPVLGWTDWGTAKFGVSVLNRALFDHQFSLVPGDITSSTTTPQVLDVTLLHSLSRAVFGDFPSESMKQQGTHEYRYALVPHNGGWREAQTPRRTFEFNSPPIVVETTQHTGTLPQRRSYLALNPASDAVVSVFQREGNDVVVRLYDTTGRVTSQTLSFPYLNATTVDKTNLLGDFIDALGSGSQVDVSTVPEEIATLRLNDAAAVAPTPPSTNTDFSRTIDLASGAATRITGVDPADLAGRAVTAIGDIDGDGYDDIVIGANQGDGPNNQGASGSGEVSVVFGGPRSRFANGDISLRDADMTLYGFSPDGFAGTRVTSGDFDCDGFSDIAIGSVGNPTGEESRNASGVTWVVFGGPRETLPLNVNLHTQADLEIWGRPGDIAGEHVTVADLDGNGCDDLVIGAPSADGKDDAIESSGEVDILLGGPRAQFVQSGTRVLGLHQDAVIYGAQVFDHFGWAIESGDFDNDGYDDLAISAVDADGVGNVAQAAGDFYLFWGGPQSTLLGKEFFASKLDNMSVIYGIDTGDLAGFNFGTGDVDGDGYDDLLVGVPYADGKDNAVGDVTGEAALWFGRPRAQIAKTNTLATFADVRIYGSLPDAATGHTVFITDLNGDGKGDLVIGAPVSDGFQGQRPESGSVHVLLGRAKADWPADIVLGNGAENYVIRGAKAFESTGFALSAGDIDGDGRADLVIGAPFYSGNGAGTDRVGAAYVLFSDAFDIDTSDVVKVERAEWNPDTQVLQVDATSSAGAAAFRHDAELYVRENGNVTQITDDPTDETQVVAKGGAFAWDRFDGPDPDIFFWNGGSVVQITADDALDGYPRTDGTGVVWMSQVNGNQEIFYWDGTTVQQITDNTTDDLFPDISNGTIVWMGFDGHDYEIYEWRDGVTTQLTDNDGRDQDPRIDGDDVVWSSFDGHDYEIELYDGTTTTQLTNDDDDDVLPQIENGQVVWQKSKGGDVDLFLWNGSQTITLADNTVPDTGVVMSQGRVAWSSGDGDAAEIYLYDPNAVPTIRRITNDAAADVNPALDGSTLVWEKRAAGAEKHSQIWSWDGTNATPLTAASTDQSAPLASGGRVAWLGDLVDSTLHVPGLGNLDFDPATGLYSGRFTVATPPPSITIASPIGGAATVDVATLPGVDPGLQIQAVTNNGDDLVDRDPQVWGSQVIWSGWDGHDYEIYLYDGTSVQQLTDNETDDTNPRIWDGRAVWEGSDGHDTEIFYWDGTKVSQLTSNDVDDHNPRINGTDVVWEEGTGASREIVLYRAGAKTRITRNSTDDSHPAVENGVVVWQGWDGHDYEIYRWERGHVTQLTNNDTDDVEPLISGGVVAWRGFDGSDWEVFERSGSTTTQITDDDADAEALTFQNGVAAWQQSDGNDTEIEVYAGGTLHEITSNDQPDEAPSTDGTLVVWESGAPNAREIYSWNVTTGVTTRLTQNSVPDEEPQVQGGHVVWQAPNGSPTNLDVYLYDGTAVRNLSAAGDGASDQKPTIGAGNRIAWQGFDGDPEIFAQSNGGPPQRLSSNRFDDFTPQVDAVTGWVIWHGLDGVRKRVDNPGQGEGGTGSTVVGGDFEIYLWDGTQVRQLTNRPKLDDFYPYINDGKAVWLGGDGHDVEVFFWDGTTTKQLTNNDYDESNARTYGGHAVWQGWDGHDMEIFYYDGTSVQQITNNDVNDVSPAIWGNEIVWSAFDGHDYEIMHYDTTTGVTTQLTSNDGDDVNPQIANGIVVWQGFDGHDFEIYRWDGLVITQITNDELRDERPRVDALGRIVWQKFDGFDLEIYYRAHGENHRVTDNLNDDSNPEIFDGTIVWQSFDGHDNEIERMTIP